ncbi:hypothetical protein FS837_003967, partial [Tulasnella sp. UAMH 9824]
IAKRASTAPTPNQNGAPSGATCANCKLRPAYKSHRYCGKTCASIASRQSNSQPYSPPVIGYQAAQSPSYQVPPSPSYSGPYPPNGPPSGYPSFPPQGYGYQPAGPSGGGPYSPVPSAYPSPQGYRPPQPNGWRSPPSRRLSGAPNRHPRRRPASAADFGSEGEYPSESDDDRRRPNRRPIQRKQKDDDRVKGNDSGYPSTEEEQGGRGRGGRGGDRRDASGRPETRRTQSEIASSSRNDSLCIAQASSQDQMGPGIPPGAFPGSPNQAGPSDGPPAYSDIEDE